MNALVTQTHFADTTATSAQGHHTIFTPLAQGVFLECLAESGNVRLACRKAGVSPQTAYRARRRSAGFARAWDTARVSARTHAEEALADRALNGWEEPVFYHGEEIARRRRFSDRLLLAHLARLDRLAEREDVGANMAVLDEQIEALKRGEDLPESADPHSAHPEPVEGSSFTSGAAPEESAALRQAQGERNSLSQDTVPCVPSCRDCGGRCDDPRAQLGPQDCQWLGNRLERMHAARPGNAKQPHEQAREMEFEFGERPPDQLDLTGEIEALQLEAFEADGHEWWLVTTQEELMESVLYGEGDVVEG